MTYAERRRERRNRVIVAARSGGTPLIVLADVLDLSRSQVCRVLQAARSDRRRITEGGDGAGNYVHATDEECGAPPRWRE